MNFLAFLLLALALAAACVGGAALALSQARNWRSVVPAPHTKAVARAAHVSGWSFWLVSLAACVARDGWGFAALLWPLALAAGASCIALVLAFRPGWMRPLAAVLVTISGVRHKA